MDRDELAAMLEAGRSIESIARETGKSASTVGYWVNKHGLISTHASRHAARGGIEREQLEECLSEGLTLREIANRLGVSYTTVRHWMARFELSTPRGRRLAETAPARAAGAETTEANCPEHGLTTFVRRGNDGFRCRLCRTGAVQRRRRDVKRILVEEAGGACVLCGYDRSLGGLALSSSRPGRQIVCALTPGSHALARLSPRGSGQMRPALLELPRGS